MQLSQQKQELSIHFWKGCSVFVLWGRCSHHQTLSHPPLSCSSSDLKMDPDILPQFSTPELFLSAIISQSVWKRTLLPILLLPEHHSTDNQAFPAPTVLSVPPKCLNGSSFGLSHRQAACWAAGTVWETGGNRRQLSQQRGRFTITFYMDTTWCSFTHARK